MCCGMSRVLIKASLTALSTSYTGKQLKEQVSELEVELTRLQEKLQMEGQRIPNMTHPDVPIGSEDVATLRKEVLRSSATYVSVFSVEYIYQKLCFSRSKSLVSSATAEFTDYAVLSTKARFIGKPSHLAMSKRAKILFGPTQG